MKRKIHITIRAALIIGTAVACLESLPILPTAVKAQETGAVSAADQTLMELEYQVAGIWGSDNVWLPRPKIWVQYEPDLGERHAVDFENGVASVQILLKRTDNPKHTMALAHLRQGVGNLILKEADDPAGAIEAKNSTAKPKVPNNVSRGEPLLGREIRVYLVRPGDSLWKIARRFRMDTTTLAQLNKLSPDAILPIGLPLKVVVFSGHDLTLDSDPKPPPRDPLLLDQIRMADGSPVPAWMVKEFAAEVVGKQPYEINKVIGEDGVERLSVGVSFNLVPNHLEVRARKFKPLVQTYAEKYNLDPALILAIIHTESVFNPRARSSAPAYGLMQLVPHSGGREAYRMIYGQSRKLTPQYLYDPKNNIELGTAYFDILENKYMGSILDPVSRSYCAVAAYNAGASGVGRAFIPQKSIKRAIPVINTLEAPEVYARLTEELPYSESRNYVRSVFERSRLYRD